MISRANKLAFMPEYYNTLWNNCVGNVIQHINQLAPHTVSRLNFHTWLAGFSGSYAYDLV